LWPNTTIPLGVRKQIAGILAQNRGDAQLEFAWLSGQRGRQCLPATLQFLITMIACAINERMQRKLDYTQEEVRVLKDVLKAATGSNRIVFTAQL
jgi:hypothetical protein